jgi:hypothetical protein
MYGITQCYIYNNIDSYNSETPDVTIEIKEIKQNGDYLTLNDTSGYNHIINLTRVFAVTYKSTQNSGY